MLTYAGYGPRVRLLGDATSSPRSDDQRSLGSIARARGACAQFSTVLRTRYVLLDRSISTLL